MTLFAVASNLADLACTVWCITSLVLSLSKMYGIPPVAVSTARHIWAELRPLYLPAAVFCLCYDLATRHTGWLAMMGDSFSIVNWWIFKDTIDDDRWKRRRRKATDKVKALASGRLVAAPSGA